MSAAKTVKLMCLLLACVGAVLLMAAAPHATMGTVGVSLLLAGIFGFVIGRFME